MTTPVRVVRYTSHTHTHTRVRSEADTSTVKALSGNRKSMGQNDYSVNLLIASGDLIIRAQLGTGRTGESAWRKGSSMLKHWTNTNLLERNFVVIICYNEIYPPHLSHLLGGGRGAASSSHTVLDGDQWSSNP